MMRRIGWLIVLVAYVGLVWYGATAESGPIGWLDSLQQGWFGGYSHKASFAVVTFAALIVFSPLLVWLIVADAKANLDPQDAANSGKVAAALRGDSSRGSAPRASMRGLLMAWLGVTAAIWIGCVSYGAWEGHVRSVDASARYVPFNVKSGAIPPAQEDHLALDGQMLWTHAVAKRASSSSTPSEELVPIVGVGWRDGDPVGIVARIDRQDTRVDWRSTGSDGPIRVRVSGAVPTAALQIFRQLSAPVVNRAVMVTIVPSASGKPDATAGLDVSDLLFRGILGSAVWAVSMLAIGLSMAMSPRKWGSVVTPTSPKTGAFRP